MVKEQLVECIDQDRTRQRQWLFGLYEEYLREVLQQNSLIRLLVHSIQEALIVMVEW